MTDWEALEAYLRNLGLTRDEIVRAKAYWELESQWSPAPDPVAWGPFQRAVNS